MALLKSCCGCSLATSSAVLGVYLLIAYIIAFMIELWWILESSVTSPVAAYLLCLGYFLLFAFSTVLLRGLSIKRITYLLLWLFMMGILLGPEAGLVLYMSIHYWRITSVNGLIEITCWACRLLVNAIGILCVQSLHSNWREEKSVLLRLEALKSKTNQDGRGDGNRLWSVLKSYKNPGYEDKETVAKIPDVKPYEMNPPNNSHFLEDKEIFKPGYEAGYVDPYFTQGFNEFNAFSFDPAIIDARLPYLTIRKKPKELVNDPRKLELDLAFDGIMPKTHSLVDLTVEDLKDVEVVKFQNERMPQSFNPVPYFKEKELIVKRHEESMDCLDKKIIKNKNLKVLKKKLSPFCRKKSIETINIYPINPPNGVETQPGLDVTNLDTQLNKVYSNRGMYTFEEKSKKIFFYPPEFFQNASPQAHRNRTNSFGNLSHSSMDSEDIKQIGDVAL